MATTPRGVVSNVMDILDTVDTVDTSVIGGVCARSASNLCLYLSSYFSVGGIGGIGGICFVFDFDSDSDFDFVGEMVGNGW